MRNKYIAKVLSAVLGAALLVGTLAGCGVGAGGVNSGSEPVSQQIEAGSETTEPAEVRKIYAVTGASPRPFIYYGDDTQLTGQNYELVTAIFDKLTNWFGKSQTSLRSSQDLIPTSISLV